MHESKKIIEMRFDKQPLQYTNNTKNSNEVSNKEVYQESTIVIIGAGPIGVRCAQLILDTIPQANVILYDKENSEPYNRIKLSDFLAGNTTRETLDNAINHNNSSRLTQLIGRNVVSIDRKKHCVIDSTGYQQFYTKLIIATGSTPKIPAIKGLSTDSILTFRTLHDAERLAKLKHKIKHLVILGGGLLGLETAAAMRSRQLKITLISRQKLLSTMINKSAAEVLESYILSQGIQLQIRDDINSCRKKGSGHQILFDNGEKLDCDALLVSTGINPNIELASAAGIKCAQGVTIDDFMRTSDPDIYAVGECAEHNGRLYGYVYPGFEQAKLAISHINGVSNPYQGSLINTKIKVYEKPILFVGEITEDSNSIKSIIFERRLKNQHRQLFLRNGRLVGFIVIGEWEEINQLHEYVSNKKKLTYWQVKKFRDCGLLWEKQKKKSIRDLPSDYIVCLCNNVTVGTLNNSMAAGNRTIESLAKTTNASTTCGTCRPLLNQLLNSPVEHLIMRHHRKILWASIISILIILSHFVADPFNVSLTVQGHWKLEKLWFDNFWKQVSGYTILALCLMGSALSVRKRWSKSKSNNLDNWRYAHSVFGGIALIFLLLHTGIRLGENLNRYLMVIFLLATLTGSVVGVVMATSHHWTEIKLQTYRRRLSYVHYTLLWTLPSLLAFHILSVYYF